MQPHKRQALSLFCWLFGHAWGCNPFWFDRDDVYRCRRCGCFGTSLLLATVPWPEQIPMKHWQDDAPANKEPASPSPDTLLNP